MVVRFCNAKSSERKKLISAECNFSVSIKIARLLVDNEKGGQSKLFLIAFRQMIA